MPEPVRTQIKVGDIRDVVEFFNSEAALAAKLTKDEIKELGIIPLQIIDNTLYFGKLARTSLGDQDMFLQKVSARGLRFIKNVPVDMTPGDLEVMLNRAFPVRSGVEIISPLAAAQGPKRGFFGIGGDKSPVNLDEEHMENRDMDPSKVWDLDLHNPMGARVDREGKELERAPSLVYTIIQTAIDRKATDIHIEAGEDKLRIRYRIDGELEEANQVPKLMRNSFVSAILVNSTIDIGHPEHFQSGRAGVKYNGKLYDLRIEKQKSVKGQEIVIRILDKAADWSLDTLNFSPENMAIIKQALRIPYGLILITGPTGSGKSTTLFAMLKNQVASGKKKVLTVENPVEYEIKGANQVNVHEKADRNFDSSLRSFLRQDPDVIMVGEIRDKDVATMAAQAAETGHLVFSTLHTNDAPGAFPRLSAMGLRLDLLISSVELVLAQRLVRRVNPVAWEFQEGMASDVIGPVWTKSGLPDQPVTVAVQPKDFIANELPMGHTNPPELTRGRLPIHEVLLASTEIKHLVNSGAPAFQIKELGREQGMLTMWQDGLRKVGQGVISMDSLLAQVKPDDGIIMEDENIVLGRWDLRKIGAAAVTND